MRSPASLPRSLRFAALISALACAALGHAEDDDLELSGDILMVALPGVAYASTFAMEDPDGRIQFYKSFATNLVASELLKQTIDKDRPENNGDQAFPSRHASVAFQGAAFVHRRYGWKPAIPAYSLAAYVGWTRVESDQHDWTDVAAGAALGIATSDVFTKPYKGYEVAPYTDGDSLGFTISKSW